MLVNFFNSGEFRDSYDISFSYRYSAEYADGLGKRLKQDLSVYPLQYPDLQDFIARFNALPRVVRLPVVALSSVMLTLPVLLGQIFALYRMLKRVTPDVLHINNGGYPGAMSSRVAAIAGKMAGVPKILMVVNNMAIGYNRWSRRFEYPLDQLVTGSVDLFVTGSQAAARQLSDVLALSSTQVMPVHNGISIRQASETADEARRRLGLEKFDGVVFGVVALLIPRKGHRVLLEAVKAIVEDQDRTGPPMKVMIEGDGPLREELVEYVEQHGLKSFVSFIGNEANIVNFMTVLDVLILPSVQDEDFPNVVLEAMALGKPVIASRLAGTPEQVVDGESGILVEPRDVSGLADAMKQLLNNHSVRMSMGQEALKRFKAHFTASVALENYSNLYRKLIEDSRENHA
jgi:glycosyltransferase involved in cell wall biosynthesis